MMRIQIKLVLEMVLFLSRENLGSISINKDWENKNIEDIN
jgi:hypothetical protein